MAKISRAYDHYTAARRSALLRLTQLAGACVFLGLWPVGRVTAATKSAGIAQPATADRESFMARAEEMRRMAVDSGDQAYGAVIVRGGRIVGHAPSRVVVNRDPTAHGEMEAIRDAARRLGTSDLSGCVMYTTARPCPMCETAAYWADLDRVYFGRDIADSGPPKYPSC